MLKWIVLSLGLIAAIIFTVALLKFMLKTEKDSKNKPDESDNVKQEEYQTEDSHINIHSATGGIPVTDMSAAITGAGFTDKLDDEFDEFSEFARNYRGRRRKPIDFDLDGDFADEYIPDSPDFSYIPRQSKTRSNKSVATSLNELPTELKVLMLSDIFDRKFF